MKFFFNEIICSQCNIIWIIFFCSFISFFYYYFSQWLIQIFNAEDNTGVYQGMITQNGTTVVENLLRVQNSNDELTITCLQEHMYMLKQLQVHCFVVSKTVKIANNRSFKNPILIKAENASYVMIITNITELRN